MTSWQKVKKGRQSNICSVDKWSQSWCHRRLSCVFPKEKPMIFESIGWAMRFDLEGTGSIKKVQIFEKPVFLA
jgi:hypothetical protein